MNILLINHYAGSPQHGMEYRPYYLAREWVQSGHQVHILASSESHVRTNTPILNNQEHLDETIDGIQYTWFKTPTYKGNSIGRLKNMAVFVLRLFHKSRSIANKFKPDIVIASSTYPMDIWPARRIAKLTNAKLIFEVHDLWPLSPMELGEMSKWHPFIMLVQQAEDYAYRHADIVVSMLPKVRGYMESRGMASHKLHIIPNGISPAEWQSHKLTELETSFSTLLSNFKNQGISIVGYAGTHGVSNALDTMLDTANLFQDEKVLFVLVGQGSKKKELQQRAAHEKIKNIIFLDPVKKSQIPKLLQYFDIAYIGWRKQSLYRFGIAPNKLMDYMMAERVVLHSVQAGNDPVTEAACGLTVPPENPQKIAQGIRHLLGLSTTERITMGQRGRKYILKNHTYPVLAKNFLKIMQDV
ncbi:glycosyltransferase family 4 protein [uncultured Thiothrix sp.]|jgi:glycosyltransferase involved in cell wall biosynthesis|uniref:glycosyltransferase family 4 protein n=1 Tax=uncultured Thiothrix sp. TaxID=223185 RepID=UPI00260E6AB0|nr:glycosyltransferase family 4 protein [uncultured Thiothrix sp.]HMT93826.1 glycosyltransferase family 4 protein [Thiolinea sp.]